MFGKKAEWDIGTTDIIKGYIVLGTPETIVYHTVIDISCKNAKDQKDPLTCASSAKHNRRKSKIYAPS